MRFTPVSTAACLLLCCAAAMAEAPFSFDSTPGRLPKTVVPEDYSLRLTPDLAARTFDGQVSIAIKVRERVRKIVLNARDLEIAAASIADGAGAQTPLQPRLDGEAQTLSFDLPRPLAPGAYRIDIAYRGKIVATNNGLYLGSYPTASGDKQLLATQMEPSDARRVVPCWDEPAFRSTFQTSVDLPASWTAYSNTPAESVENLPSGLKRTRFARTPKMASYLLVLVAGELERLEGEQDGVRIGIVTTQGKRQTGEYALKASRDLLKYYNEYFGVAYPLPKLDQIAVAATGGFGAMENWGGITYDEGILLFDPKSSADRTRRSIYSVVAHEMAHQWFGDLVTMAWWDNLWLNEGFASWMGTKATDHFNPDWDFWQQSAAESQFAMQLDARKTTHPIQQPIKDEAAAASAFDRITYLKGMAFLRMLETWLGEDAFRAGMRVYMRRHQYSNTTTADLWDALENASGKPVRRMAAGWTRQPGFPVIKVAARCVDGMRKVELKQERFTADGRPDATLWAVPVGIDIGGTRSYELLDSRSRTFSRPGCDAPLTVDPDAVGYFRVEYAPDLQAAVVARWRELSLGTRRKLLADAWALAGIGRLTMTQYVGLLRQARNDTEPSIWREINDRLLDLDKLFIGEPIRARLQAFGASLLRPRMAAMGWDARPGDPQQVRELRPRVLMTLGLLNDAEVRDEAQARFRRFLADPASLPPSIADAVIFIAGRYADGATYDALLAKLRAASGSEEQNRYLRAVASALDASLGARTLALSTGDALPAPVTAEIPALVAVEHPQMAWAFARQHHRELLARASSLQIPSYFGGIVEHSSDPRVADELEAWGARNLPREARTNLARTADEVRVNAKLKARLLPQIDAALATATP